LSFSKDSRATTAFMKLNGNQTADAGNFDWGVTTNQAYLPVENHSFLKVICRRLVTSMGKTEEA
jgi:hypothetical protein